MSTLHPASPFGSTSADIEQPLLQEETLQLRSEDATKEEEVLDSFVPLKGRLLVYGTVAGFLIQVISLSAYVKSLMTWGQKPALHTNALDEIFYFFLQLLTQIDLCVYSVVWVGFTCSMTKAGVEFIMSYLGSPLSCTQATRRFVFLLGVNILVGLVLGAFLSWSLIDLLLGFPVPYIPVVATAGIDLVLCYLMTVCYDCGREREEEIE